MARLGQFRRDTLTNWMTNNPILADGEFALVATDNTKPKNYNVFVCGDGTTQFSSLKQISIISSFNGIITDSVTGDSNTVPSNNAVSKIVNEINVDKLYPLSSGYYTLTTAIAAVASALQKLNAKITFTSAAGVQETYQYTNNDVANWLTVANWEVISITGKYGNLGVITNLNTIARTGNYTAYGTATGAPSTAYSWFIEHINSSAGTVTAYQRAIAYSTDSVIYERTKIGSTWGNWVNKSIKNEAYEDGDSLVFNGANQRFEKENLKSEVGISDYEEYDPSITYNVGNIRVYQGNLYKCISNIETAENWNPNHWIVTSINSAVQLQESVNKSLLIVPPCNLDKITWYNIGFSNNGLNDASSSLYKLSTRYFNIPIGTYYIRMKAGYRFSCVSQDEGNINNLSDETVVSGYAESQYITISHPNIRLQIVKWTNNAIDTSIIFNLFDAIEFIQILQKKDRVSNLEDTVQLQESVNTERIDDLAITNEKIADNAISESKIASLAVSDDKLQSDFIKSTKKDINVNGIANISSYEKAISLKSPSSTIAYLRGKNIYNTIFDHGDNVSLLEQKDSEVDLTVSGGTYRAVYFQSQMIPSGDVFVSCEITILSGLVNTVFYLYFNGIGNIIPIDSTDGKYKIIIKSTITSLDLKNVCILFSVGTAINDITCNIKLQVEYAITTPGMKKYIGKDVSLSTEEIKEQNIGYEWIFGNNITATVNYDILQNKSKRIVCWGDSLTDGTGSTDGKPSTDLNLDTSYPSDLELLINDGKSVINMGVGGETSWMISARQGGMPVSVMPFTMPSTTDPVQIQLIGLEQNMFYNSGWNFMKNNLKYSISPNKGVNPCYIGGIKGVLSYDNGNYYFARESNGDKNIYLEPQILKTYSSDEYRNDILCIWMGQNDAPLHDGQYILQPGSYQRARQMIEHGNISDKKYIVMNAPSGNDVDNAMIDQLYTLEFGKHFINIRKFICEFGVEIANNLGANITLSESDNNLVSIGQIPTALKYDSIHLNYWGYKIVAKAVYTRGTDLGYWN